MRNSRALQTQLLGLALVLGKWQQQFWSQKLSILVLHSMECHQKFKRISLVSSLLEIRALAVQFLLDMSPFCFYSKYG